MDYPEPYISPGKLNVQRVGMVCQKDIDQHSVKQSRLLKQVIVIICDVPQPIGKVWS